ncbi:MAG: hypothetical protein CMJ96_09095 [Planctomycetes bacterium]|nr:hypothetical protein [Planctomycetota bacterium]
MRHQIHYLVFVLLLMVGCSGGRQQITTSSVSTDLTESEAVVDFSSGSESQSPTSGRHYRRINQPDPVDLMDVAIFQLDNGLTIYLTENHEEPRFYAEVVIRAGAKNDPEDATGLAHYLEHLLFKGTQELGTVDYEKEKPHLDRITELYEQHYSETDAEKRKEIYAEINAESQLAAQYAVPNEIDKLYQSMGASFKNAGTGQEVTIYQVNLPSNRLQQWAQIESHRLFGTPVFRLFHSELEVVYEEKNRALDNKSQLIRDAVYQRVYKKHPYSRSILGTVEHLKKPSLVKIYDFFKTYYVPNNMAICISGDIDIEKTIQIIADNFNHWEPRSLPEFKQWQEDPIDGVERVTVQYQGEEYVMIAFRTVPQNHPDAEALMLFDMILDNATAGLINLNLNQQQKVRKAGSRPLLSNDYGSQELWGIPKKDQSLEEVEQLLLEQITLIKQGQFENWIIPAIVTDFKTSQKAGLENNESRAGAMRGAFLASQDWHYTVRSIERMEKLTKEDVVVVANKYFGDNYVVGYRIDAQHELPQVEKPPIDPIEMDPTRQSAFAASIMAIPVNEIKPVFIKPDQDYQIVDYYPGVKLYHSKNPVNDLFTLTFSFDIGKLHNQKLGAAALLLDKSGTSQFSAPELKKEWYKLGSDFGLQAGDQSTSFTVSGLDENFGRTLALALNLVKHSQVDQATLQELIQIILANREDAKKNYRAVAQAMAEYNLYGDKSSMLRMISNEKISQLTVPELTKTIADLLSYRHTISYVGSLSVVELQNQLRQHHLLEGKLQPPPSYEFFVQRRPEETEIYLFDKEMAQAYTRIDFGDDVYDEAKRPAINLYNEYFDGGMSGVVFQELREARALAYASYARYAPGSRTGEQNQMVAIVLCQADKTAEAVEAFIGLIDNLPISEERFAIGKEAIINRYKTAKVGFREVIGAVRRWEYQGLEVDPRVNRYQQIQQSDLDLMLNFHRTNITKRKKLISIVGDKSKIDMEALARHGKITEISLDQIFVF